SQFPERIAISHQGGRRAEDHDHRRLDEQTDVKGNAVGRKVERLLRKTGDYRGQRWPFDRHDQPGCRKGSPEPEDITKGQSRWDAVGDLPSRSPGPRENTGYPSPDRTGLVWQIGRPSLCAFLI